LWLLVWLACPMRARAVDPVTTWIAESDAAWDSRASGGLDPVAAPLLKAQEVEPRNSQVLWRLSRYHVANGLAVPVEAISIREFAAARESGILCLSERIGGLGSRTDDEWSDAMADLTDAEKDCLGWTAYSWARWMAAIGGRAGAIDWPRLDAVLSRADHLADPALADAAIGLADAVRPEPDPVLAAKRLESAASREGADLIPVFDLQRFVAPLAPQGDVPQFVQQGLAKRQPRTPEEIGAAAKAAAQR
jgi:hypothetical protein